jgi:hypothetical protein
MYHAILLPICLFVAFGVVSLLFGQCVILVLNNITDTVLVCRLAGMKYCYVLFRKKILLRSFSPSQIGKLYIVLVHNFC